MEVEVMGDLATALEAASGTEDPVEKEPEPEETGVSRHPGLPSYEAPFMVQPPEAVNRLVSAHLKKILPPILSEVSSPSDSLLNPNPNPNPNPKLNPSPPSSWECGVRILIYNLTLTFALRLSNGLRNREV